MLDIKKLLTKLLVRVDVPKQLDATIVKPSGTGWDWTYKTVNAIANYNLVGVRFRIVTTGDIPVDQMLIFPRYIGNWPQSITWYNGSTYVRGRVIVEWDTNQVGVALINGNVNNAYCVIQQIYGFARL